MYYGGGQKRPDAPYARPIRGHKGEVIGHVGEGNRKDVRNAVEAAHKAAPGYLACILNRRTKCRSALASNILLYMLFHNSLFIPWQNYKLLVQ